MAEVIQVMPELEDEESLFVAGLIKDMSDDQARTFAVAYRSQRRDPTNVLLFTLLGFVIIAGVQRFYLGQIGMGLFTFSQQVCALWAPSSILLTTRASPSSTISSRRRMWR